MRKLLTFAALAGLASAAFMSPVTATAKDLGDSALSKERFQIRVRGIGVLPDDGGHTTINGSPTADDAFVPEVDFTYFFTEHVAAELIVATSPHDLGLDDSDSGDLDLGDTMILPPTLTLQYHFTPDNTFSPYIGAGINYTLTYGEDSGNDTTKISADNGVGYALQAGMDYWLDDHWGLNFDVKKVWVDVDASINSGAITGNVELDPWIVGAGVSYRF